MAAQLIHPSVVETPGLDLGRSAEIKQRLKTKYSKDLREELFGSSTNAAVAKDKAVETKQDIDELVKYAHRKHEEIAENMIDLARQLKNHAKISGDILKKDTSVRRFFFTIYSRFWSKRTLVEEFFKLITCFHVHRH